MGDVWLGRGGLGRSARLGRSGGAEDNETTGRQDHKTQTPIRLKPPMIFRASGGVLSTGLVVLWSCRPVVSLSSAPPLRPSLALRPRPRRPSQRFPIQFSPPLRTPKSAKTRLSRLPCARP